MISRRILFLALTLIMASVALGGQAPRAAADRVQRRNYLFKETNENIEYAVFVSSKVDARKKNPLVIALHGAGVPPAEMIRSLLEPAEKHGYIVAAPMGYNLR